MPLLDPLRGLFDSDVETETEAPEASRDLHSLQELQLNDAETDGETVSGKSEELTAQVSDQVFASRSVDAVPPVVSKKRKAIPKERTNFVRHNLRRRRKNFAKRPAKMQKKTHPTVELKGALVE